MSNTNPKFVPNITQISRRVYSNFATVRSTGLDFTLSFADVTPPTKEDVEKANKGEEISVPLQCEIVVPNDFIPNLIGALQEQYERFQKSVETAKAETDTEKSKSKQTKNS